VNRTNPIRFNEYVGDSKLNKVCFCEITKPTHDQNKIISKKLMNKTVCTRTIV